MILDILWQSFATVDTLLELRMRDVASHNDGSVERQTCGYRIFGELGQDLWHGPVEVDFHAPSLACLAIFFGDEPCRVVLQLFDPDSLFVDLRLDVAVGRAGDAHPHGTGGTVTRQADHPHIVRKIFPSKLCSQSQLLGGFLQPFFQFNVAESPAQLVSFGRQVVVVLGRCQLHRLQVSLCRGATNHEGHVVRGTGSGTQRLHFFNQEAFQLPRCKQCFRLLVEIGLVGRSAPFSNAKEVVFIPLNSIEVNLCREVGAGIHLIVHVQRSILGISQVLVDERVVDPL